MPPLAAIERFFERLFERPSARLFRTHLQPIQIQRRIERAMETRPAARVATGRSCPNRYVVHLHPDDLAGASSEIGRRARRGARRRPLSVRPSAPLHAGRSAARRPRRDPTRRSARTSASMPGSTDRAADAAVRADEADRRPARPTLRPVRATRRRPRVFTVPQAEPPAGDACA